MSKRRVAITRKSASSEVEQYARRCSAGNLPSLLRETSIGSSAVWINSKKNMKGAVKFSSLTSKGHTKISLFWTSALCALLATLIQVEGRASSDRVHRPFWKSDDFTDVCLASKQHDDTVDPGANPPCGGAPKVNRAYDQNAHVVPAPYSQISKSFLHSLFMNTNAATRKFVAIQK